MAVLRQRPSSRLLIVDPQRRLLLFRFEHVAGPLCGRPFWATPGGGLEPGETFEQAAIRELLEETGLERDDPGPEVARRTVTLQLPDGEWVAGEERYFLIRVDELTPSSARWTELERQVMTDHRWWTVDQLRQTDEQVWPESLADMLP